MLKRPGEVLKVGSARRDLFEIARHLGRTSRPAADRFLAAADATFARLATFPELGAPWIDNDPELSSIRCGSVDGFRSHVVYYTDSRNFLRSALCHFFCATKDLKQITERREFIESVLPADSRGHRDSPCRTLRP